MVRLEKIIHFLCLLAICIVVIFLGLFFYFESKSNYHYELLNRGDDNVKIYRDSYLSGIILNNEQLPSANNRELRMLFFGDLMIDRHVGEKIKRNGLDHLFNNMGQDFFEDYDIVGANLEGAVTNEGEHYSPVYSYDFAFHPDIIKQIQNYNFNFFNLANNHFSDQGERGIIETRQNLEKLDFNYVGCEDGIVDECSSYLLEKGNRKIGIAGFSMVYRMPDRDKMSDVIRELASSSDIVVVNVHWGVEYTHERNQTQKNIAYEFIDSGADIIIGHHPHVVQGIEIYESKRVATNGAHTNNKKGIIFYSLGNFIFDQYFSQDTQEGLAVGVYIKDGELKFKLFPLASKSSQIRLMDENEQKLFLEKFLSWSDLSENYIKQLSNDRLIIIDN